MRAILRFFFYLLYHPFAFTYDLVAATVSLGRWKDWVLSVVPFLEGNRILEIGHGPGHLQRFLLSGDPSLKLRAGPFTVGIDESAPMGRLAKRNLARSTRLDSGHSQASQPIAYAQPNLARCVAQHLPFSENSFDTVVATFPAEYIFHSETLHEAWRVLAAKGRFVILPGATILGRGILDRFMAFIFHLTGQSAPDLPAILRERTRKPFGEAGFHVQIHELELKSSLVFVVVATKSSG